MGNSLSNEDINERLHRAAERGDLKELQKYFKKGGDLNRLIENENFQKPPSVKPECQSEKGEAFDSLVNSLATESFVDGKPVSTTTTVTEARELRMNALHRAASRKHNLKALQYILRNISDVDEQDSQGDSALHYVSALHNNDESLVVLLKFKPNVNLQNDRGETALFSAVIRGCDLKVIEWLLRGGANPDICNIDGDTPLHACAMRRGIDPLIPGILLRFGANPNLRNRLGQTPLHIAAETTNDSVLLLLKFNAKVRLRDNNGNRPSEVAASEEIKKVLLEEESDLIERTVKMSDIIAREESQLLEFTPSLRSATNVQNWLNTQDSFNSLAENGKRRGESSGNSRIMYPNKSQTFENGIHPRRVSVESTDSYYNKFAGGGGHGIINLPNNVELIVPPDVMPMGTFMEVSISPSDADIKIPDLSNCNFKFDIKVKLPGKPASEKSEERFLPPVFTGMCLEGQTTWKSIRDIDIENNRDTCVKFTFLKEKSEPLTKRPSSIRVISPITSDIDEQNDTGNQADCSDSASTSTLSEETRPNVLPVQEDLSWSRQETVCKENDETPGSCDESSIFSTEDDNGMEDFEIDDSILHEENTRIHHPIDQELATIAEEDGTDTLSQKNEDFESMDQGNAILGNVQANGNEESYSQRNKQRSTCSVDGGYKEFTELIERQADVTTF